MLRWSCRNFNANQVPWRRGETFMQDCRLKVLGCAGAAFLALASGAENLERYLWLPGGMWITVGTMAVGWWAGLMYCAGEDSQ